MAEPLAPHLRLRHFHAALVADHTAVFHAFVLAAETLPVGHRTKNTGAEQAVAFRLKGAVVDRLGLGDLAMRPLPDFFRGSQRDANRLEVRRQLRFLLMKSKHFSSPLSVPLVLFVPFVALAPWDLWDKCDP
jgi:hypothetical protein